MKTLADVKRRLVVGARLTMTSHSWYPQGKLIGLERKIEVRQSQSIKFEGGSWLQFPPASRVTVLDKDTFSIQLDPDDKTKVMTYIITE
jgi:hypothetical protein